MQQQRIYQPHKSSMGGVDGNFMALLVYLAPVILGFIPVVRYVAWAAPLVFFFLEKNSLLVKFHAMQALAVQIVSTLISIITGAVTGAALGVSFIGGAFAAAGIVGIFAVVMGIFSLVLLVCEIIAMYKAYHYIEYRIPVAGKLAVWLMSKMGVNLM